MFKSEFIQGLKQNNVSKNPEKTMERLRAVWSPLEKAPREEILSLAGLKKSSVERAYKTGNVSAKILAAVAQVLKLDPYYLAGFSDENRPFVEGQDYVSQFLTELGYEPGKSDTVKQRKQRKPKAQPDTPQQDAPEISEVPASPAATEQTPELAPKPGILDVDALSAEISKLMDSDAHSKIDKLTEDDIVLMLRSLSVQAGFSDHKKNRLTLIKQLLLL